MFLIKGKSKSAVFLLITLFPNTLRLCNLRPSHHSIKTSLAESCIHYADGL